ncbi:hypothetical protein QJS66_23495 (plasmid) [Kocuria rhizophila]|nr:hypothetical protein QJS66_23495 [Kocuria rhizophila]
MARFAGRALALIHGGGKNEPDRTPRSATPSVQPAVARTPRPGRADPWSCASTIGNVTLTGSEVMVWCVMGSDPTRLCPCPTSTG